MAGLLISGPAGANKSAAARRAWEDYRRTGGTAALADFQSVYAALTGDRRGPDGRYPLRDKSLLPLVEYVRRTIISAAQARDIYTIATNSDGNPERRSVLLNLLGAGATERILDPGRSIVEARLSNPETGDLSDECGQAVDRWYGRL